MWPLVFRREPLWKVSMNVRVRPTVRCTFDEEDSVLRVVLKETAENADGALETRPQELVIYALKVRYTSSMQLSIALLTLGGLTIARTSPKKGLQRVR